MACFIGNTFFPQFLQAVNWLAIVWIVDPDSFGGSRSLDKLRRSTNKLKQSFKNWKDGKQYWTIFSISFEYPMKVMNMENYSTLHICNSCTHIVLIVVPGCAVMLHFGISEFLLWYIIKICICKYYLKIISQKTNICWKIAKDLNDLNASNALNAYGDICCSTTINYRTFYWKVHLLAIYWFLRNINCSHDNMCSIFF